MPLQVSLVVGSEGEISSSCLFSHYTRATRLSFISHFENSQHAIGVVPVPTPVLQDKAYFGPKIF
jgi:hypothetical protein